MNIYWDGYKSTNSLGTNWLKLGMNPVNLDLKQLSVDTTK